MMEALTFEPSFYDFKDQSLFSGGDISLLGKIFPAGGDSSAVREYVTSRLWFTYRKNFAPIGGTGPSSDQGWGCMMRCAQMLMGEVLLRRHVGIHWEWKRELPSGNYERILRMFADDKNALYSIHQIAQMAVSEGKGFAEWIGPNTAAQVLKKLAVFDAWSSLSVHVALDNVLISSDVHQMATTRPDKDAIKIILEDGKLDDIFTESLQPPLLNEKEALDVSSPEAPPIWRPVLILVPLRLGLSTINDHYLPAVKAYFNLPQCIGILGGRPNHALFFVGIKDDKLIYLDPHYTQNTLNPVHSNSSLESFEDGFELAVEAVHVNESGEVVDSPIEDDSTFHCPYLYWMDYKDVDPSLALGLYCSDEDDFEDLKLRLKETVLNTPDFPLFEQLEKRPPKWPKFVPYMGVRAQIRMAEFLDMGAPNYESDDQFEILEE